MAVEPSSEGQEKAMRKTFLIFGVLGLMMILSVPGWAQDLKELERRIDIMSDELDALKESVTLLHSQKSVLH